MQVDKLETSESLRKEEEQATETQPIVYGKNPEEEQSFLTLYFLLFKILESLNLTEFNLLKAY